MTPDSPNPETAAMAAKAQRLINDTAPVLIGRMIVEVQKVKGTGEIRTTVNAPLDNKELCKMMLINARKSVV